VLEFLAREISPKTWLNLMDHYHPAYKADEIEPLARRLTREEWHEALDLAERNGLTRLDGRRRRRDAS